MIGDILDLSKIESGTLKFVWSDVNINAMIYDLEKVFQLRNKNNPEVEIRFVPGMEECVIRTERLMGGGSVLNSSREKVPLFGLPCLSDREIVNSDVSQISHVLSRRDRLRLETTRPSDPRTETILRQLKGMGNGLSAPRKAKKTVVLGLDVNFTKRERERILRE